MPQASFGQAGESCASRADCDSSLSCIDNVCVDPFAPADAGLPGLGKRGESCQTARDCGPGLGCIGGTCTLSDFGLGATGKECVLVECHAAADCCPEPSSSCDFYKDFCDQGDTSYCSLYESLCVCDETEWACADDQCVFTPACDSVSMTCTGGLVCAAGRCVECATDADCGIEGTCLQNTCLDRCERDGDCPYFHRCESGACVESGCQTNRECVASTRNVLSFCQDGECLVPCETDFECDSPTSFRFSACIDGFCRDLGCETSEECRIFLSVAPGSALDVECR